MGLLGNVFGGRRGGMSPLTMGLLGLLAYRTLKGKGRLADMMNRSGAGGPGAAGGGIDKWLGGLLGGSAAGSILSGGLGDLIKSFQEHGQGDKAESWVSRGPNKAISGKDLEEALGSERINWLMNETGMSREELLAGLSQELPEVVDKLTPDGRLPTEQEAQRLI